MHNDRHTLACEHRCQRTQESPLTSLMRTPQTACKTLSSQNFCTSLLIMPRAKCIWCLCQFWSLYSWCCVCLCSRRASSCLDGASGSPRWDVFSSWFPAVFTAHSGCKHRRTWLNCVIITHIYSIYSFIGSLWPSLFTAAQHSSRCCFVRGLSQSHTLFDSHLPLSSKPSSSYHLGCLECCRLVYVINDSFTGSESQQTTPSVNYHPMSLLFILKLSTGSITSAGNQVLQEAAFSCKHCNQCTLSWDSNTLTYASKDIESNFSLSFCACNLIDESSIGFRDKWMEKNTNF